MTRIFDLQFFAGESGAAAGEAATTGQVGQSEGNKGGEEKVVYGIEAPEDAALDADAQTPSDETTIDIEAEFDEAVKGKYKDVFAKRVQKVINQRFKDTKTTEERLSKAQPILDTLIDHYKTDDLGKLDELMLNDPNLFGYDPSTDGLTDAQKTEMRRLKQVERGVKRAEAVQTAQQQRAAQVQCINEEAAALKAKYPAFDLEKELQNPAFIALAQKGVPMEAVFKAVHYDEMLSGAVTRTEQQTADAVVANVRARGARPAENGAKKSSGVVRKTNPADFTREETADIVRRIRNGEKFSF